MNIRKPLFALLLLAGTISILTSCKKSVPKDQSKYIEYHEYVSGFTSGEISVKDPVKFLLAKEISKIDSLGTLPDGIARISPGVKGSWTINDNRTVVFEAEDKLKPDTEYSVSIALHKLIDVPKGKQKFNFNFRTIRPDFTVFVKELQSQADDDSRQFLTGTVNAADVMDVETVEELLTAKYKGKNLDIEWLEPVSETEFPFQIVGIERQEDDAEVEIKWNGKKAKIDNKGESIFSIPGLNNFSVVRAEVVQEPEQYLAINFSDRLAKNQKLEGLIDVSETDDLRFEIDGNVLKVYPRGRISGSRFVSVRDGVNNSSGYKLKHPFSEEVVFESLKPEVRLVSNGNFLPGSKGLKFNFEAVNVNAVDVRVIKIYEKNILQFLQSNNMDGSSQIRRVGRPVAYDKLELKPPGNNYGTWRAYSIDLANLMEAEPGAIYRVELGIKKAYSTYTCDDEDQNEDEAARTSAFGDEDFDQPEEDYWDNQYYYDEYFDNAYYSYRDRDNPCKQGYYGARRMVAANIIASDLGLIAKKGENGNVTLAVTDLLNAKPVSGADVTLYNYQQDIIAEAVTDSKGFVKYDGDKKAFFAVASHNESKTYLKLYDGNSLSLSKFDVSGSKLQKGLKGYIYGDRGIWRPGDSLFLTFMLNDKNNRLPENHPVKFELRNPHSKLVNQQVKTTGYDGFYRFTVPTQSDDPTGNWSAKVEVGGANFYKNIKVETIKPNRLKINFDFDDEVLKAGNDNDAEMEVKWLHGAAARDLKVTVDANVRPKSTSFDKYSTYIFDDPVRSFKAEEVRVHEGRIDNDGKTTIASKLKLEDEAPGMLRVTYLTKVFENGGSFSVDAFSKDYAPYNYFIGIKPPKGDSWNNLLITDEDHSVDVLTLSPEGKPIAGKDLEVDIYKISWRWWWNRSSENLSSYIGSKEHTPVYSTKISTGNNGKTSFKFQIKYPDWGRYLIRVKDPEGGHATGHIAYIDWPEWRGRSSADDPEAATMLAFSTDKKDYNVGEDVKVTFPSGDKGRALISIENGSKVLDAYWVESKGENSSFTFKARPEMAPNVFVNITYVQPHGNTVNDLPIRLYGVAPISVLDPGSKLTPFIRMASELKPESDYKITVSETNGKPMTYTLAVVDEGLLDLTRFKTPNAWDKFFQREALGVKTWDMFDQVIGAYGGRIDQVFSIGGGDEGEIAGAQKANRFKPVVRFIGPFTLGKNKKQTHDMRMPNYVGSVRVMVVAGNRGAGAYGSAEKAVPVKKPLMILGTLPRKLSQTEKVSLPVSVFAMDKKVKNVKVEVKSNNHLKVIGSSSQTLKFDKTGEKEAMFELDASGMTGVAKVDIVATGGGEKATYQVELDVINPNLPANKYEDIELKPNESKTLSLETFGISGTNEGRLELSVIPQVDYERRLQYLIRYPHGCVEQLTSSGFPQLYLTDVVDLSEKDKKEIQKNVTAAIYRLAGYQHSSGGMHYWYGHGEINDWATSYAGHFMIEAKNKGFKLPAGFLNNWKQYQKRMAKKWNSSSYRYKSDLTQAYRLYTLALLGEADLASMNRLRESKDLDNNAKWRLAAAYALAGQKQIAERLMRNINMDFNPQDKWYSYGSEMRNRALALETLVQLEDSRMRSFAEEIASGLSSNRWYSTQTTAFSLLAISKMVDKLGGKGFDVQYDMNGGARQTVKSEKALALRDLELKDGSNTLLIKNNKNNTIYVRVHRSGIPPLGTEVAESRGLSVTTRYLNLEGKPMDIISLDQGTDFAIEITVNNLKNEYVNEIALTQMLPSGWEIVNTRYTEIGTSNIGKAEHIDIRDDRINYYFDLSSKKKATFRMLINASYEGKFYLPPTLAEAMYDNDFYARTKGQWVDVVRP